MMSFDPALDKLLRRAWSDVAYGPIPEDLRAAFASALMDAGWRPQPLPDPIPADWTIALRRTCTAHRDRGLLVSEVTFDAFIERLALWAIQSR